MPRHFDPAPFVKDIRAVSRSCLGAYAFEHATIQISGAARELAHTLDLTALRLCVDWLLAQESGPIVRGWRAALRLDEQFTTLARHRVAIEAQLRAA